MNRANLTFRVPLGALFSAAELGADGDVALVADIDALLNEQAQALTMSNPGGKLLAQAAMSKKTCVFPFVRPRRHLVGAALAVSTGRMKQTFFTEESVVNAGFFCIQGSSIEYVSDLDQRERLALPSFPPPMLDPPALRTISKSLGASNKNQLRPQIFTKEQSPSLLQFTLPGMQGSAGDLDCVLSLLENVSDGSISLRNLGKVRLVRAGNSGEAGAFNLDGLSAPRMVELHAASATGGCALITTDHLRLLVPLPDISSDDSRHFARWDPMWLWEELGLERFIDVPTNLARRLSTTYPWVACESHTDWYKASQTSNL